LGGRSKGTKYRIEYTTEAKKQLDDLLKKNDKSFAKRVKKAIDSIGNDPKIGKALKGRFKGCLRHRFGVYRIVYRRDNPELIVQILTIEHRKSVYR